MKTSLLALVMLAGAGLGPLASVADTQRDVRVVVATPRNHRGHLICSLFDSEEAYSKLRPAQKVLVVPTLPETTCVFHNVDPGTYMVSAIHDENDNQKLDKNLFGMPKEGYGVSNNHTYAMKAPVFSESTFSGAGTTEMVLKIELRYPN
jgi:uncharacterized protein (DUF2141 family)